MDASVVVVVNVVHDRQVRIGKRLKLVTVLTSTQKWLSRIFGAIRLRTGGIL